MKTKDFLMKDEEIIKEVKFSPLAFVGMAIKALIQLVVAIILMTVLPSVLADGNLVVGMPQENMSVPNIIFIIIGLIFIICAIYNIIKIIIIINTNNLVVTNKRIYGRVGVIKKETIDIPLTKVDNVASRRSNIWAMIFNYYSINVSSTVSSFTFNYAANANEFKVSIFDAQDVAKKEEQKNQAESMARAMMMAKEASKNPKE